MRHIYDTFKNPPRNGERFRDGEHVVEYGELDGEDKADPCDVCCYDKIKTPFATARGVSDLNMPICADLRFYAKIEEGEK